MKLSWYGTASVMLESDGYRLLFDPFLGIPIQDSLCRRKLRAVKLRTADAVLVTHGHFDHILDIPRLYKGSDIKVYATKTPCRTLIAHGLPKENLTLISPGVSFKLGNFTIHVYQGRHCRFDLGVMVKTIFKKETLLHTKRLYELIKLSRRFEENGETLFYEIEADDKITQPVEEIPLSPDRPLMWDIYYALQKSWTEPVFNYELARIRELPVAEIKEEDKWLLAYMPYLKK